MRGDSDVRRKVAGNSGARFSDNRLAALVQRPNPMNVLAERTGMRLDFPIKLLRDLLARATEAVRNKLLAIAPPEIAEEIRRILADAAAEIDAEASKPRNYDAAQKFVALLKQTNEPDEKTVAGFAYGRKYEETVAGLALLSGTPIDIIKPLMRSRRHEGLLVPCRAANMQWPATKAILQCRFSIEIPEAELKQAEQEFKKLSARRQRAALVAVLADPRRVRAPAVAVRHGSPQPAQDRPGRIRSAVQRCDHRRRRSMRRECAVENVSQTGAKLILKADVAGLDLAEFILVLSPSGSVFRRCQLARHHGMELGVRFIGGSNT